MWNKIGKKLPNQDQHVGNSDDVRLVSYRHGALKEVFSELHVGHGAVEVKGDIFLPTLFSENKKIEHKSIIKQAEAVIAGLFNIIKRSHIVKSTNTISVLFIVKNLFR